jgi:hypothetical protein
LSIPFVILGIYCMLNKHVDKFTLGSDKKRK